MGVLSKSEINSIPDFRTRNILLKVYDQLDVHNQATGTNWLAPTNSPQKPASAPPAAPSVTVTGSNGSFVVSIVPAPESVNKTTWFQLSYSSKAGFTEALTTMEPTQATSIVIPAPGATFFFRVRASFDKNNWGAYGYA